MKCVDIKSNAFRVPLLIWIVAVLVLITVHPVKADTGIVTVTSTNDGTRNDNGNNGGNIDFNNILVDTNDFNTFQVITISSADFTGLGKLVDYTTFTITSGGSGTGVVSYVNNITQNVRYISWFFDDGDTFGGNPTSNVHNLTLSYTNSSFFSGATLSSLGSCVSNYLSSTFPISMSCGAGKPLVATNAGATFTWQRVGTTTSANYSVSYLSNNRFTVNFTKSDGAVNTKGIFYNNSGYVYFPDTVGKINFDFVNTYTNGLLLNFSTSSAYKIYTLNSSGITVSPTPTPAPGGVFNPPLTIPSSGGTIQFNQTKYVVGDTVRVEWAISDTEWNSVTAFELDVTHEDGTEYAPGGVGVSAQTGNYSFVSTKPEIITATLKEGLIFRNTIATAQTSIVPEQPSTLLIPSVVAVGKPINFTYMYGFTPQSQATANGIFAIKDGFAKAFTSAGTSVVALTTYSANITFPESGIYVVQLKDITRGVVAFVSVNATFSFVPPTQNISVSALSLDKPTYLLGDAITADYAIDNTNYSQYQVYYQVFNYGLGIIEDFGVIGSQTGQLYVDIAPNFASGLSKFSLRAKNNTADFVVIYQNFTASKVNNRGFGMQITPSMICAGTKLTINLTIPEPAHLDISETEFGGLFSFKSITLTNNSVVSFVPKYTTTYTFDLIATADGSSQIAYTVSPGCGAVSPTPSGTINPGGQGQAGTPLGIIDGWTAMFGMGVNDTSRFLFAVIIIVLVTISGFILTGNNGTGGIVLGFVPYAFFTHINYVPKWFILVAIIIMGIKLRWFN